MLLWNHFVYSSQEVLIQPTLLVPLFISAFRRATDLAMAMEARCYRGGEGRTKMKPLRYEKRDRITYLVYAGYFLLFLAAKAAA